MEMSTILIASQTPCPYAKSQFGVQDSFNGMILLNLNVWIWTIHNAWMEIFCSCAFALSFLYTSYNMPTLLLYFLLCVAIESSVWALSYQRLYDFILEN